MNARLPCLAAAERQLILCCARRELGEAGVAETKALLAKTLAWDLLVPFAELHGVAPLLHHHLRRFDDSGLIPPAPRRRLLQLFHRAGFQNRAFCRAFQELADAFAAADAPVIVPKGLSLLELVYGNLSLRLLIDLVLFVRAEERERATQVAVVLGYADATPPPLRSFDRWYSSQVHLVKQGPSAIHLLLQWDLLNRPTMHAVDFLRLWEDAEPTRLSGRATLVPSPVDLVLYLCLQAAKHGYLNVAAADVEDPAALVFAEWTNNRLIRFTDIFETIRHYQNVLDWALLTERARMSGVAGQVYASLRWVTRLFGPVVDPGTLECLRSPVPRRVQRWLFDVLAAAPAGHGGASIVKATVTALALRTRTFPRPRFLKILTLVAFVFPRRDELRLRYARPAEEGMHLAYVAHVGRSLWRCAGGVLAHAYWTACQWTRARTGLAGGSLRDHPRP